MGEVSLHGVFLFLRLSLDVVEFHPLSLHIGEARILCSQCVNVGNDARISQMEEGIVDNEVVVRRGIEDSEISVSQP
jgi:hypothetical protein